LEIDSAVLYSGGSDSTLAAALSAEKNRKVHLLTFDRISFLGAGTYTQQNLGRLKSIYGSEKFSWQLIKIGKWHKCILYERYMHFAKKYKLATVGLSFTKLAMHWRAAVYCIENGIEEVADGMVPYMHLYTDQNKEISLRRLKKFYQKFGINYVNPVYNSSDNVEQQLYDRGIIDHQNIRGTKDDRQVYYAEQILFALFLKYYLTAHGYDEYERVMGKIYDEKILFMENTLKDWVSFRRGRLKGLMK